MKLQASFLNNPNPVTAIEVCKDCNDNNDTNNKNTQQGIILAVGDDQGGVALWKVSLLQNTDTHNRTSSSTSRLSLTKLKYIRIVPYDNPSISRSSIVQLRCTTKQLLISTKEIPPIPINTIIDSSVPSSFVDDTSSSASSSSSSSSLWLVNVETVPILVGSPQAVHCIDIATILKNTSSRSGEEANLTMNNNNNNNNNNNPLVFTLDGHKDVVRCILPLPNGNIVTCGGKFDATTKVWSRLLLQEATVANNTQTGRPPTIVLTKATIPNLCKDAGYIFAAVVLEDFKPKVTNTTDDANERNPNNNGNTITKKHPPPFAIAVARYNVVKIVL